MRSTSFPPRAREVLILGRIEGLTGREIAQRLGIAETTVSEHLAKAMHALTATSCCASPSI